MTDNLLDAVEATLRAVDADARFRVVPVLRADAGADVSAIALHGEAAGRGLAALHADPAIASVEQDGQRFLMRFADERIAATGAGLEAGRFTGMETRRPARRHARGRRLLRSERDEGAARRPPAQHRARAGGGERRCALPARTSCARAHIGDAGRSMGEAMAGWRALRRAATPAQAGVKSDQFVGELYARYVREEARRRRGRPTADAPGRARPHEIDDDPRSGC